ncbi:transcriptional regulator, TetR family [Novosphingobium mathurense]|uniref:Transcriptional regulator, TetR family n=2 Tax=Novosphingobium mathurense TaxID=428990 RepID=A0A1U6HP56_9SPHN|nr:transcriptional regulator, TetR family [Novosphingobium mathurense]
MTGDRVADPNRSYHRDDLRTQLVEAAADYVEHHGHEDLSVRKLAQVVGVSPGAPYHHFPDRRSLLIAVALTGYDRLLGTHRGETSASPEDGLMDLSRHFIAFAEENPRIFSLMYESELTRPFLEPAIAKAQSEGFAILRAAVRSVGEQIPDEALGFRVAAYWSLLYGFTLLRSNRMLQRDHEIGEPEGTEVVDAVLRQAIRLVKD